MAGDEVLEVRLHGVTTGNLAPARRNGFAFQYDQAYLARDDAVPLSLQFPLRENAFPPQTTERWFNGLLPEGDRRARLARIFNTASADVWTLLRAAGGECAGAVQVVAPEHRDAPSLFDLSDEALGTLLQPPAEPITQVSRAARISLAGAQDKVVLYRYRDGAWAVPLNGHPSTHILKPEPVEQRYPNLVANEHWCMEVARRSGVPTAKTRIEYVENRPVLVVERYDRYRDAAGTLHRIHQEDTAQALGSRAKYQEDRGPSTYDLFAIPGIDRNQLFEHLMLCWILGNCDAHAKNYSLLEPGTPRARLAPAYDIVSTDAYPHHDRTLATNIGTAKSLDHVTVRNVNAMARRIGFEQGEAIQRVQDLVRRIESAIAECGALGIERGPVRLRRVQSRIEKARSWYQDQRSVQSTGRDPETKELLEAVRNAPPRRRRGKRLAERLDEATRTAGAPPSRNPKNPERDDTDEGKGPGR